MRCPDCGYVMSDLDAECLRCRNFRERGLPPPSSLKETAKEPAGLKPEPAVETLPPPVASPSPQAQPTPHVSGGMIVSMWTLTVISWALGLCGLLPIALPVDVIAIVLAFVLVGSRSPEDRGHGKAKLWLELIAFVIGFFIGVGNRQSGGSGYSGY